MKGALGLGVVGAVVALAVSARAAGTCGASSRPGVSLVVETDPPDSELAETVARHFDAALAARGIDLCPDAANGTAHLIGHVSIRLRREGPAAEATIALGDEVTRKRVERSMDLGLVPSDGWPLALASSADELLRASWTELMLADAPPAPSAPPAIAAAVVATTKPKPRSFELSAEVGGETSRARTAVVARLLGGVAVTRRLALLGAATSSFGFARASAHGDVRADDVGLEGGAALGLTPIAARRSLRFEAAASALRVSFVSVANPGAQAISFTDWSVMSVARLRAQAAFGAWRASLAVGAGYPVRAARALDQGATVTSNEGVTLFACLGIGTAY